MSSAFCCNGYLLKRGSMDGSMSKYDVAQGSRHIFSERDSKWFSDFNTLLQNTLCCSNVHSELTVKKYIGNFGCAYNSMEPAKQSIKQILLKYSESGAAMELPSYQRHLEFHVVQRAVRVNTVSTKIFCS
eukprot:2949823-Amphidinium_carterae.1